MKVPDALRDASAIAFALARPGTYAGAVRETVATVAHAAGYVAAVGDSLRPHRTGGNSTGPSDTIPVVLVHGFGATPSHWSLYRDALGSAGFASVSTVAYNPLSVDVEETSTQLVAHIERVCEETGANQVHLVGHSLGGVIARHTVELGGAGARVATAVTICSPHGGTPWAAPATVLPRWSMLRTVSQLRVASPLLRRIENAAAANAAGGWHAVRWVAFYANTDWVVPASSAKIRVGNDVTNVLLRDEGHLSPIVTRSVADQVAATLAAHEAERHRLLDAA